MTLEVTIIKKAEELAQTPGMLTRFAEARRGKSIFSQPCRWDDPQAQSWCMIGLIKKVASLCIGNPRQDPHRHRFGLEFELVDRANQHARQMGYPSASWANDTRGPKVVQSIFSSMKGRAR